jgi:hypothetical protein
MLKKYDMAWTGKETVMTKSKYLSIHPEWGRETWTVICMAWSFKIQNHDRMQVSCASSFCVEPILVLPEIWFPKGLLTVIGSWHRVLKITGTQSEGFWKWFIEMCLMFWHCPSCGGIKIATFVRLNVSLSSIGEERWELYPLGPTGRRYHWCRWRQTSNRYSIVGYITVHLKMETNPLPSTLYFL